MDVAGLAAWVKPAGFVEAKSEVVFLMKELDSDGDKVLSAEEIMEGDGGRLFLEESRATYVGKVCLDGVNIRKGYKMFGILLFRSTPSRTCVGKSSN